MSVVTSSLSVDQEKKLLSLFGHVRLHLLYKASIHGYAFVGFSGRCNRQGPTVIAAYNKAGFVFGAYTTKDYAQTGHRINDERAFLYSIHPEKEMPLRVGSIDGLYGFTDSANPNYGALAFLINNSATVQPYPGNRYNFDAGEMHGNDLLLTEFEVYRVEDCGGLLETPWRTINWKSEGRRKELIDYIQKYKPELNSVNQARVLLVGPVGAGKSSFVNSVNSVFRGHVTGQAATGSAVTSLTTQFRTYSIKSGRGGKPLSLVLCDTMGLEEGQSSGLDADDITTILKGQTPDRYQFNPSVSLQSDNAGFRRSAGLKGRIHCVVYILDACKVKIISAKVLEKFAAVRKKVNKLGVPQLLLLTKVDEACPLVRNDLSSVYRSYYIEKMVQEASVCLGMSVSSVLPVKNYSHELELDLNVDILLLSAVVQILRLVDDYFDDVYEKEGQEKSN